MSLKPNLWHAVIQAIEAAIPEYDEVNEKVSFGRAMRTRKYAADRLEFADAMLVLDAGIGPGTMSEVILSKSAGVKIVGLDASTRLLRAARDRFRLTNWQRLDLVRGAFEALPFRDGCFQRIVTAYAFRDARDRKAAISEFYRISAMGGTFAIADLGKPDNRIKRAMVSAYIRLLLPLIAHFAKSSIIKGNPWRMIVPTYQALTQNENLVRALQERFSRVDLDEFFLGGIIVALAHKTAQ